MTKEMTMTCAHCGRPAACYGSYEGHEPPGYACDACCGHMCEDGWCRPLPIEAERDEDES